MVPDNTIAEKEEQAEKSNSVRSLSIKTTLRKTSRSQRLA
jgi:hypothetical protein